MATETVTDKHANAASKFELERIQSYCHQADSIVRLVREKLDGINGTEEAAALSEEAAIWSSALDGANLIMLNICIVCGELQTLLEGSKS